MSLVAAETPAREAYVYPAAAAGQAEVTGGLAGGVDELYKWDVLTSPEGKPGSATFSVQVPLTDRYRLLARVKSPDDNAALNVKIDGKDVGSLLIEKSDQWRWVELALGAGYDLPKLTAEQHTVTIEYPKGQKVALQKVCLTNELRP